MLTLSLLLGARALSNAGTWKAVRMEAVLRMIFPTLYIKMEQAVTCQGEISIHVCRSATVLIMILLALAKGLRRKER